MLSLYSEKQEAKAHLAFCYSNGLNTYRLNPFPGAIINIFNAGTLLSIELTTAALIYLGVKKKRRCFKGGG